MEFKNIIKRAVEIRKNYADLEKSKYGREWSKKDLLQGLVGDVGDLSKFAMAKDGLRDIDNADRKFEQELAECLWSVLVLAEAHDINMEKVFLKKMNELDNKIEKLKIINDKK